jgi:N-acetylglucosamine malate deacetylase 1
MRILAVGAHPDDLEILCGGTLAAYRQGGHDVVIAHATDGARGGAAGSDPEEVARTRTAEAAAAAAVIGAELVMAGLPDGAVAAQDPAQRHALVELVRAVAPDVVLTHHPEDYHGDHRKVSELVFWATFAAANPMVDGAGAVPSRVPALLYLDTLAGLGPQPTEFVDISAHVERKRAMLAAHGSQLRYLQEAFGADAMDQIEVTGRFRGQQAGVRYAEAFHPCTTWHRVRTTRLLP